MVGYVVLGGLVFRGLEAEHERRTKTDMRLTRIEYVRLLANTRPRSRMSLHAFPLHCKIKQSSFPKVRLS